ncbi:MAG: rane protein [Chitinophagaceae bacterium]|nr:rane protein [Chitinophagaceae bacterium]MDB5224085.1 rane protein [Chitinophagaceae bacterium]
MNKFLRALIAGYGAKKLGGGCLSTILIFLLIYWALGNCNSSNKSAPRPASLIKEQKVATNFQTDKIRPVSASLYR